jgi:cell division protein FtsL
VHWLLVFALLLAAAFIEVWESTAVSQLSLDIDRLQVQVRDTQARTSYLDARVAESSSRVRLAGYARTLNMRPADPAQVVVIPRDFLAAAPQAGIPEDGLAAATRRAAELFVPSARARGRREAIE